MWLQTKQISMLHITGKYSANLYSLVTTYCNNTTSKLTAMHTTVLSIIRACSMHVQHQGCNTCTKTLLNYKLHDKLYDNVA